MEQAANRHPGRDDGTPDSDREIASGVNTGPNDTRRTDLRPGRKTNRQMPSRECPLSEGIVIDRFWRNRRGEAIVTSLEPYEGRVIVHVRQFFTDPQGRLVPSKKGIAIGILRLPELMAATAKALKVARERGLLPEAST